MEDLEPLSEVFGSVVAMVAGDSETIAVMPEPVGISAVVSQMITSMNGVQERYPRQRLHLQVLILYW